MAALVLEASAEDKAFESSARAAEQEPVSESVKVETPAPEPKDAGDNGRDEKGRFASQKADSEPVEDKPATETKAAAPKAKELPRVAPPKFAPVGALQDERGKRQAAQEAAEKYQTELLALRAEIERMKNPPKAVPDPNLDPDGYNRYKIEQLESKVSGYEKETAEQKRAREQHETVSKRIMDADAYEVASREEFRRARPEQDAVYMDAVAYYRATMERILPQFGIRGDTVTHTINDMLLRAVEDAKTNGENAVERIWNLASNLGFQAQAKPAETQTQTDDPPPIEDKTGPALEVISKSLDKLTTLQAGQKAAKSVASGGGPSSKGLTLNEVLASAQGASLLEETELDKMSTKDAKRKLFRE